MRYFIFILLLSNSLRAQELRILSAKDSSVIPFAFLSVKNNTDNNSYTSDIEGKVVISHPIQDSILYTIQVQVIGYKPASKNVKGKDLKTNTSVFLIPNSVKLDEIVITAQYETSDINSAIQKVQVIDAEKIAQMGAVNLKDVFTNQLNIRLEHDNILGTGMKLQGIGGENVKFLIDGAPIIGRLNGTIDLSQINLNNIERIEIIEGPLSVQYGTNAIAGTINLISKKGRRFEKIIALNSYYESIGTYNLNIASTFSGKMNSLQVNGGRNYFDGWHPNHRLFQFPKSSIADSNRFQQWKPKEQYFFNAGFQKQLKKLEIGLKSNFFNEKITNRGYPRAPYAENSFDDFYYTNRMENCIFLQGRLSNSWKINSVSAYNYFQRLKKTVFKDLTTLSESTTGNSSDQDTNRFNLFMSRASFIHTKDSALINFELGYDINLESALGKRISEKSQSINDYAVFASAEYKPYKQLVIKPALRIAYNSNYKAPLVPSLNLKWDLDAKHILRMSYGKGFRSPSLKELYFYFVDINHNIIGNQNLKSENSNHFTVNYNYNSLIQNCSYKLDFSAFYNDISNLITLSQTKGNEYSYINIGRFKTMGLQIANSCNYKQLFIKLSANYTGRYNIISENSAISEFSYSPEVQFNFAYQFIKSKTNIACFYKYNGKLPSFVQSGNEIKSTYIEGFQILDVTISQLLLKNHIQLTLGCKNIFNIQNVNSNLSSGVHSGAATSVPISMGRNYFIQFNFKLTGRKNEKIN